MCDAHRCERSEARGNMRAGHYERKLRTKADEVWLRMRKCASRPSRSRLSRVSGGAKARSRRDLFLPAWLRLVTSTSATFGAASPTCAILHGTWKSANTHAGKRSSVREYKLNYCLPLTVTGRNALAAAFPVSGILLSPRPFQGSSGERR